MKKIHFSTLKNCLGDQAKRIQNQCLCSLKTLFFLIGLIFITSCEKNDLIKPTEEHQMQMLDTNEPDRDDNGPSIRILPKPVNSSGAIIPNLKIKIIGTGTIDSGYTSLIDTLEFVVYTTGDYLYAIYGGDSLLLSKIINVQSSPHIETDILNL